MKTPVQLTSTHPIVRRSINRAAWRLRVVLIALAFTLVGALAVSAHANPRTASQAHGGANAQRSKIPFHVLAPDSSYVIDDGTAEQEVGTDTEGDLIALNEFAVIPGSETITSVSIAWGSPPGSGMFNGLPYTVAVWSDPNGDGDPRNALLLTTSSGVISMEGTNTFITTLVTPTTITTPNFFVGFLIDTQGYLVAAFDQTDPTFFKRSYYADSASGTGNIENLNDNDTPVVPIESFGPSFIGNWLIRADVAGDLTLTSAASRKNHGNAGTFDIDLPLTGTPGVECRVGNGGTFLQTIVFTFSEAVTSVSGTTTTTCGSVTSATFSGNTVTVQLGHVNCDGSDITVEVMGVTGASGSVDASVTMTLRTGDVNADGVVNNTDLKEIRMNVGRGLVNDDNFRDDITVDGKVNHGDTTLEKSKL